ncbi:unnamed protein product [Sphagnum troendelagicum]|uniref:Uncharacterized protein n=1 Tax=Sphagnum troendelagicum TaxID=128251 RepID=A0ABP0U6H6_9BRYO
MESRPMMYRSSVEIDYAHDESVISKETADVMGSPVDGTTPLQRGLVGSLELESHAESVLVGGGGGGGGAAAAADVKLPSSGPLHQQTVSPKNKTKGTVPFYKLFSFAAPLDYALMILGTLAAFAHGTSFPVFFIFFSKLINEVASNFFNIPKQSEEVAKYGLYFFYLGIISLGTAWIEVACWMQTGERQSARIRTKYLRAILAQDIAFFDKDASTGEIVSRISNDTLVVQEAIGEKMGIFLHYLAMFVAGICVSLSALWQITLVTLSVLPIIAVTGGIYITYKTTQASRSQEAYMMASVVAEEAIAHIRTVYSFVGESKAMSAYQRALQGTMKTARKAAFAKGLSVGIMHGALIGIWALLFWYASKLVIKGAANGAVAMTTVVNAVITGKSVAIVGSSGSGKSTVISLIERFYDPTSGVVTVDGKDIRTVKLRQLRQHIGLVQQEPSLFATTIYENILYGREGASESEVINAAKAANAHNFISALPNGYKTAVGERGVQLSGGQKQRVAIARAVLKDPAILLLDEATSALDSESERVVQAALDSLMRGRTTVLIAHRLSTIRNVDTIAFISDGQVQEKGSHESLMSKPESAYAQFVSIHQQK